MECSSPVVAVWRGEGHREAPVETTVCPVCRVKARFNVSNWKNGQISRKVDEKRWQSVKDCKRATIETAPAVASS